MVPQQNTECSGKVWVAGWTATWKANLGGYENFFGELYYKGHATIQGNWNFANRRIINAVLSQWNHISDTEVEAVGKGLLNGTQPVIIHWKWKKTHPSGLEGQAWFAVYREVVADSWAKGAYVFGSDDFPGTKTIPRDKHGFLKCDVFRMVPTNITPGS